MMKKILRVGLALATVTGALLPGGTAGAQDRDAYAWQIGVSAGYMTYYGDVSPYYIGKWTDWKNALRFFQYNKHYIPQASYGVSLQRRLTPTTGILIQADHGKIAMSDRYRLVRGGADRNAPHWSRALNFQTSVVDLGAGVMFSADNGRFLPRDAFLSPYLYLGAGLTRFQVRGDLYDADGNPYDYTDPHEQPDGIYETSLRPLTTETAREYPDITGYGDLGLGLAFRLGSRFRLSVETDMRYMFTDYIDDVHGKYKTAYPPGMQAYAAHPGTNGIDPVTRARGNEDGVNDMIFFQKLTLHYRFGGRRKPRFSAPFVYGPAVSSVTPAAATLRRPDALKDTLIGDTTIPAAPRYDSLIARQLQHLNNQLLAYRFSDIDRRYLLEEIGTRDLLQALRRRRDSVAGERIPASPDSVRLRDDNHRIDSLSGRLASIDEARRALRRQVAGTPIITEYADSTKIMIYRRDGETDSAYLPVMGMESYPGEQNAFLPGIGEDSTGGAFATEKRMPERQGSPGYPADSLSGALDTAIVQAAEDNDILYLRRLYGLRRRLDSIRYQDQADSVYAANTARIREDSLQLMHLLARGEAASPSPDTTGRNFFRRLMDRIRGNDHPYPRYAVTPDTVGLLPPDGARYPDAGSYSPEAFARSGSDPSRRIEALEDDIARLRNENERYRRNPPETVYLQGPGGMDKRERREARRDREALYDLGRSIERSGRGSFIPPVTPQIVLEGSSRQDRDIDDIRSRLNVLQTQQAAEKDSQIGELKRQLDSARTFRHRGDTVLATPGDLRPLVARVDSLAARVERLQSGTRDTAPVSPAPAAPAFVAENYPVVSTYFQTGSASLNAGDLDKLRPVAEMAKTHPGTTLLIQGYTDGTGSPARNKALAEKRCEAVKRVLTGSYQIPVERLQIVPVGPPGRRGRDALLRRVDVTIRASR